MSAQLRHVYWARLGSTVQPPILFISKRAKYAKVDNLAQYFSFSRNYQTLSL